MYMYHLWAAGFIRILCNWLVPPVSGVPGWKHPQMVLRGYVLVDSLRREGEGEGGRGRGRGGGGGLESMIILTHVVQYMYRCSKPDTECPEPCLHTCKPG